MDPSELVKLIERKQALDTVLDGFEKWLIFFGLLVVIGVGGESLYGFRTFWNNRKLHEVQRSIDRVRQEDIAKVSERAVTAEATAKGFESQIADSVARAKAAEAVVASANAASKDAVAKVAAAEARSAEASTKAEAFRLDIARANERAASANEIAEREKLARMQLEARLADRIISPDQEQSLRAAFARLRGQTVDISVFGDTFEISQFSGTIMSCMKRAGVLLNVRHPTGGSGARGVLVGVRPDAPPEFKQAADELIAILQQSVGSGVSPWDFNKLIPGGVATLSYDPGATPPDQSPILIFIGSK
jgi:voltage-gated potassium channel Kch